MSRYLTCLLVFIFVLPACSTPITPGQGTTVPVQMSATQRAASPTPPGTASPIPLTETPLPPSSTPQTPPASSTSLPSMNTIPDPGGYAWKRVASNLARPVELTDAGDGSGRLFVVEQAGRILIIQNGALSPAPFLDITDRVGSQGSEQGLLGLVFHPRYKENGLFYVNYTDQKGDTNIARFQVSADPNLADSSTEKRILYVSQPFPNHNGGSLAFDPDGYLYIGLGDGGSQGDPHGNGQSLKTLLGKILRIDVDHGDPYTVPADNPFATGGGSPEIWAYGLRNPWRFSFDRLTGDFYIADVGQDKYEEIDYLPAGTPGGTNFGWNFREGLHPYKGNPPAGVNLQDPVIEYDHNQGCAVTGGYVYRGVNLPTWQGVYLYGDYCSGKVWGALRNPDGTWQDSLLFETGFSISSFGADQAGEVYLVDYQGSIYRLENK
jgi:glucose/arabinose dehydrogenase